MKLISAKNVECITESGKIILEKTSFDLPMQTVMGVYGPNGAGKSTLFKTICGLKRGKEKLHGEFWVEDTEVISLKNIPLRARTALYIASDFDTPFDLTVRELLELGATTGQTSIWPEIPSAARVRIAEAIEMLRLAPFLNRIFKSLSDGEKQLMMFARGLIQFPKLLVLDETFSKLDLDHLALVGKQLPAWCAKGMSFMISAHDLNFLSEISDDLLFIKSGKLVAKGPVVEVLHESVLEIMYPQLSIHVVKSPEIRKK